MTKFIKSHGLGNDYIVIDGKDTNYSLTKSQVKKICHRNYGIGSDGVLLLCKSNKADFGLKIFNPDGSQAEKSGNGLRIFSAFLYEYKKIKKNKKITIETQGGLVASEFIKEIAGKKYIKVEMGKAIFEQKKIPVKVKSTDEYCINKTIKLGNKKFIFNCVSVGTPHCVIFSNKISAGLAKNYGSKIEVHKYFPNRINVQFVKIIDRNNVQIEIWERGAGYTLASGSSSCAVVSVGFKLGLLNNKVKVKMPGGILKISINDNNQLQMEGPVQRICEGKIDI